MSKAKSGSGVGTAIGVVIALAAGYVLLKWLSSPKPVMAAPGGFVGGSYGASAYNPYGQQPQQNSNALLNALAAMLGKSKGGGGLSAGSGGGSLGRIAAGPDYAGLQARSIINYSQIANNMPLDELGGASLSSYEPYYNSDYQIPYDTYSPALFPVNQLATDLPLVGDSLYEAGGGGMGDMGGLDTTSYDGLDSIPFEDVSNFDLSSY